MPRPSIPMTPLKVAESFVGLMEIPGEETHDPTILGMLQLVDKGANADEVPWCSAFVHACTRPLGLPQTKSLRARSWLTVGKKIALDEAEPGFDLVIFTRDGAPSDPKVIKAKGHVAWFLALTSTHVEVLGGNQDDRVGRAEFPRRDVIGVRRL